MISERYQLAMSRVEEITKEYTTLGEYGDFFREAVTFICKIDRLIQSFQDPMKFEQKTLDELQQENDNLYEKQTSKCYENSYLNPDAAKTLPNEELGSLLCCLYTELQSMIAFAFEQNLHECVIRLELFLEVYSDFSYAYAEENCAPKTENIREILYWFISDYSDVECERRIREQLDSELTFARNIIQNSDLSDLRYLYRFGERITENELKTAEYINSLPKEDIDTIASVYTQGFKKGFELAGKDLTRKKTVAIRYRIGFERIIRQAVINFEVMGLKPIFYRARTTIFDRRGYMRIGYYGAICNPQFDFDHKEDEALILDGHLITRKLECLNEAYKEYKKFASQLSGPACMEVFGEIPYAPIEKKSAPAYNEKQQELVLKYTAEGGQIVNEYIKREERSFTIIAFPVYAIGSEFDAIFMEVIKLNTLDVNRYTLLQQEMIDLLNKADYVRVKGKGQNRTDLTITLYPLTNPDQQTIFENCVADVNIPVGEVFTSPVLKGTNGTLHVSRVFLHELEYLDLELKFTDGRVTTYRCANFETEAENQKYIKDNLLYHHETLPMGEFAIGTNTTAYAMAKKYGIEDKLPILIAEKMGPHFALGDTCYSQEEDVTVFNPDKKEIVAKENEISALRKTDPGKAYFHCHTDITIPYHELDSITACTHQGEEYSIIKDSRFVPEKCKVLNLALEEMESEL